jgi:hypothetical protein
VSGLARIGLGAPANESDRAATLRGLLREADAAFRDGYSPRAAMQIVAVAEECGFAGIAERYLGWARAMAQHVPEFSGSVPGAGTPVRCTAAAAEDDAVLGFLRFLDGDIASAPRTFCARSRRRSGRHRRRAALCPRDRGIATAR